LSVVEDATEQLWKPEGADALAYLHGRGLKDETIKSARLGWTPGLMLPTRDGKSSYRVSGVVIPWFNRGRLALAKIRRTWNREPSYIEVFRDRPLIFPGPKVIEPGRPLVVVEGEFDALLLGQEIRGLAGVVTLGSASSSPDLTTLRLMLAARIWFIALDADESGDTAASGWPCRARRVRPRGPNMDWTDAHRYGVNLARWWSDRLVGIEGPPLFTWSELSLWRWGPAIDDQTDGLIDDYANAERTAIQEFDTQAFNVPP
jgi:hypothetical protein